MVLAMAAKLEVLAFHLNKANVEAESLSRVFGSRGITAQPHHATNSTTSNRRQVTGANFRAEGGFSVLKV